jgi:hypothetical protein
MKGFKDTTKTIQGHHGWDGTVPRYATGGIVTPFKAPDRTGPMVSRPVMPRPHVMPNLQKVSMPRKLARGGSFGKSDGAGGPYNPPEGNTLELANRPYSKIEQDHPRNNARPGYKKGGKAPFGHIKRGALHKDMGVPLGEKIPVSKIRAKLKKDKARGNTKGVKRDVFAINAKTKFCDGGPKFAEGGQCNEKEMKGVANRAIERHEQISPPRGHGVRGRPVFEE